LSGGKVVAQSGPVAVAGEVERLAAVLAVAPGAARPPRVARLRAGERAYAVLLAGLPGSAGGDGAAYALVAERRALAPPLGLLAPGPPAAPPPATPPPPPAPPAHAAPAPPAAPHAHAAHAHTADPHAHPAPPPVPATAAAAGGRPLTDLDPTPLPAPLPSDSD